MKPAGRIVVVLVGISMLAAVGYAAWLLLRTVFGFFTSLDPDVANIAGIACLALLAAAWIVARGVGASSRQAKAVALREEKTTTYQLFVDFWESLLRRGRSQSGELPVDLAGKLHLLDRMLALYGAASVIRAHTALRTLEGEKGANHPDVRARLGEAIVSIRRDLGADTPLNAAFELERLLLPPAEAPQSAAADTRDARFRTVLATGD
jgi:hypothetical protein